MINNRNTAELFFRRPDRREAFWMRLAATLSLLTAIVTYWLTVAPSASYWDCPEYILTAACLETGHPPGNPFWTLFHRIITIPFPDEAKALAVNMASGLFMAGASALLCLCCCRALLGMMRLRRRVSPRLAAAASLIASLIFTWADSPWYSAVEAEVYAMSTFLTALCVWLTLLWAQHPGPGRGDRILILIAYITGLSIGVHQLGLLCIPALAAVIVYRLNPQKAPWRLLLALIASVAVIGCVLKGMMPGTLRLAGLAELLCVNSLGMPYFSGVILYLLLTLTSVILAATSIARNAPRPLIFASVTVLLFLSGLFMFTRNLLVPLLLSTVAATALLFGHTATRRCSLVVWSVAFLLCGYSCYALIIIRGAANPPINGGAPSDIFALSSYVARQQYGETPLLYGRTPFSRPMIQERILPDSTRDYTRFALRKGEPAFHPRVEGGRLSHRSGFLNSADSAANRQAQRSGRDAYILTDYLYTVRLTPELDTWFPRLTSSDPDDIRAYGDWAGMDTAAMRRVEVSTMFDADGNPALRPDADGKTTKEYAYKPTVAQQLSYFLGYQSGYMYWRYLMWNFSGRQNDIPSCGEADHGNFITGFPAIDDAMLGPQSSLPASAGRDNPGRNVYFMLPLLLGLIGLGALTASGRAGRRTAMAVGLLFILTGWAIIVYLNQSPGEPRERDYTFLGSYWAFCVWIAFGIAALANGAAGAVRRFAGHGNFPRVAVTLALALCAAVPAMMLAQNLDDHDRSRRDVATDFAVNILEASAPNAILLTDGDNFTFPLWYAQEVLGVRRDVTVVNVSYLALPSYIESIRQPGPGRLPVRMTARVADLAYGRYNLSRIPHAVTDPMPVDEMLRRAYADTSAVATLPARMVSMTLDRNTVTVDLRKIATQWGGTQLPLRLLAILDIVSSNTKDRYRPVEWLSHLTERYYCGLKPLTSRRLFTRHTSVGPDTLRNVDRDLHQLSRLKWGGLSLADPPYCDPAVDSQTSYHRVALIALGRRLLEAGRPADALRVALTVADRLPHRTSPFGHASDEGMRTADGIGLATLLIDAGRASGSCKAMERGKEIIRSILAETEEWRRYYDTLPSRLKGAVSPETLRILGTDTDSLKSLL